MSCEPHAGQVLSPCSDDAVGSLQALGTRGDVAFFERGTLTLTAGATEVAITFLYEKTSAEYDFNHLYVKSPTADSIIPVVKAQTATGFTLELTGAVVAANDVLAWEIQIPDALQECQSATSGPKYAIVRTEQRGLTPLNEAAFLVVPFPTPMPDTNYDLTLTVENLLGGEFVLAMIVTVRSTAAFRVDFSGVPYDSSDYRLRWKAQ